MHIVQPERLALVRGEVSVPRLGFGTWEITGAEAEAAVRDSLEIGYRLIDTARAYGNEREVGNGIIASGVPRDQIFLTTKLWFEELSPSAVHEQVDASLRALQTDYIDLVLIHWPNSDYPLEATLEEMARTVELGKVVSIGVSNFPAAELARAVELSPLPLLANQVEFHPYLDQSALLDLTAELGLVLEAYSPLANGALLDDPVLAEIGEAHGRSPAQVALRWLLEHEHVIALPRSSSHNNRVANFDVFDFELSAGERQRIAALAHPEGRQIDPSFAPDWD